MKYCAAIQINPKWDAVDHERAKQFLIHRIMHETQQSFDVIAETTTFDQRPDIEEKKLLVATYQVRAVAPVAWPVQ